VLIPHAEFLFPVVPVPVTVPVSFLNLSDYKKLFLSLLNDFGNVNDA
jgi:hypothetical protein